ncbi:hypothetical protein PO878_06185 [Iamia majanohamensis]|uniref:Uncharacterized protein n=1 Tax=Iamia majanohamensis TaxID=467976 RepID=A0AAE9Y7D2_9ACTN|nr:hypothetical protein [Iamia majanohamensis]WCO68315.1 hypothetical protein PO878_06185 [Iamia majanohamensis]
MPPSPLPDGTHDAIVVDADEAPGGAVVLHLAVLGGPHKGEVVEVRGPVGVDPLDALGVPATLTVADGAPSVRLDP